MEKSSRMTLYCNDSARPTHLDDINQRVLLWWSPYTALSPTDQGVLTQELLSLPLHSDTLRVRGRRSELEARLAEIDDAIKIFSRPKVFVKLDHYFTTRSLLHCYYYALCAKLITLIGVTWSHVYTRKLRFWWSPLISPLWSPFWSHASIAYTGYTCLNYNYLWNAYCNASQIVIKLHMILYLESSSAGIFHFWNRRTCNL